jgi:hypothetical protein
MRKSMTTGLYGACAVGLVFAGLTLLHPKPAWGQGGTCWCVQGDGGDAQCDQNSGSGSWTCDGDCTPQQYCPGCDALCYS